jgi:hypothetical protein
VTVKEIGTIVRRARLAEGLRQDQLAAAAGVVRQYLASKDIPLHKMTVIVYGMLRPVAPNCTRVGRVQNRRVVVCAIAMAQFS